MAKTVLTVEIEFDPEVTDAESLSNAMDAITTFAHEAEMFDDYGDLVFHGFQVLETPDEEFEA